MFEISRVDLIENNGIIVKAVVVKMQDIVKKKTEV